MRKHILIFKLACLFSIGYAEEKLDLTLNNEVEVIIKWISSYENTPVDPVIKSKEIVNGSPVMVALCDKKFCIYYDQKWLEELNNKPHSEWTLTGVLAHEIGHYLLGHVQNSKVSDFQQELDADEHSGYVLALMGATLDDAQRFINHLVKVEVGTLLYPSKIERLAAVENGWNVGRNNTCRKAHNCKRLFVEHTFNGTNMMLVPVGSNIMGSNNGDSDEKDPHHQNFREPFLIDKIEVTRGAYQACVESGKCTHIPSNKYSNRLNQPINNVTWYQATTYCKWRGARLPTEAEWEYAARGPNNLIYPWGNEFDESAASYAGSSGDRTASAEKHEDKGVSWVGALDMSGNVWEWTNSLYRPYPYDVHDGRNLTVDAHNVSEPIVLRGGSFRYSFYNIRAANRIPNFAHVSNIDYGFRCARSLSLF